MDYGDIIYDQAYSASFYRYLEWTQYNAALAIIVWIRRTSKGKLYQEFGFECLNVCYFYKIFNRQSPN